MKSIAGIEIHTPERVQHLPLVMQIMRKTGLLEIIDRRIPFDRRSKVPTSQCVAVLLCGVFVGVHSLWRLRERLAPYDMATIMGKASFDLEPFTEERLGKALDDLFRAGLDYLMTELAVRTISAFMLKTNWMHFDTTSLSFFGAMEEESFIAEDLRIPVLKITRGYSKINRPDLKQIMFGSLVTSDGGVPLYGRGMDGNMSDNVATAEFFERIRELVVDPRDVTCVADAKGWCPRVLEVIRANGMRLLSRLPRTHGMHQIVLDTEIENVSRIEQPPRRKNEPPEWHEIAGMDLMDHYWVEDANGIKTQVDVPVRALRVFSSAKLAGARKTFQRQCERDVQCGGREIRKWERERFACRPDAEDAAIMHQKSLQMVGHTVAYQIVEENMPAKRKRGRPAKGSHVPMLTQFRAEYTIKPKDNATLDEMLRTKASHVLIRTRCPGWDISDREMLERYRAQYHCEHGFSWLKSAAGISPMFLELPHRIQSLTFLYTAGLMIHTLIQRNIRAALREQNETLPYHRNNPSQNITTRFLFELFMHVQSQTLVLPDGRREKFLQGCTEHTDKAARLLGVSIMPIVSRKKI